MHYSPTAPKKTQNMHTNVLYFQIVHLQKVKKIKIKKSLKRYISHNISET